MKPKNWATISKPKMKIAFPGLIASALYALTTYPLGVGFSTAYSEAKTKTVEKGAGYLPGFLALLYLFLLAVWPLDILLIAVVVGYAFGKGGARGIADLFGSIFGKAVGYVVGVATKKPKSATK